MTVSDDRWQDLPLGGVIVQGGNAINYHTGSWRAFRPVIQWEPTAETRGCTHCLLCWLYCPDSSMIVAEGELQGVDLDHCKGCGLCARVCPVRCIQMIEENSLDE